MHKSITHTVEILKPRYKPAKAAAVISHDDAWSGSMFVLFIGVCVCKPVLACAAADC